MYAVLVCAVLLIAQLMATQEAWAIVIGVPILSIPVFLLLAVRWALKRGLNLASLSQDGWLRSVRSGVFPRLLASGALAFVATTLALPQLLTINATDVSVLVVTPFVFLVTLSCIKSIVGPQLSPAFANVTPISWAALVSGVAGLLTHVLIAWVLPAPKQSLTPLPGAIADQLAQFAWLADGLGVTIENRIGAYDPVMRFVYLVLTVGGLATFFSALAAVAALPATDRRRAFAPASILTPPPAVKRGTIFWLCLIGTLLLVFVWPTSIGSLDTALRAVPPEQRPMAVARQVIRDVEQIGQAYYEPGTIAGLQDIALGEMAAVETEIRAELTQGIRRASAGMERNTDAFLDGYYSLIAEYARIAAMLTGSLENELRKDLTEALGRNDPLKSLRAAMQRNSAETPLARLPADLAARYQDILTARRVSLKPHEDTRVVERCDAPPCLNLDEIALDLEKGIQNRILAGGMAGATTSMITALIVKKIIAKGTVKMAAKALTKVATSKAAGSGAGAAVGGVLGGLVGSVVPAAGTAAGAAAGAVLGGLIAGVSVDFLMLKLEEEFQREALKAQIVLAIHLWRDDALDAVATTAPTR